MHIETKRLLLRPFNADDGPGLYAYLSDENVVSFEPYGVFTEEAARREAAVRAENPAFIAVCLKDMGAAGRAVDAALLAHATGLIGNIYLCEMEFDTWELGYVFNARYWGHGYATEASRAAIAYAFENGARRVTAFCDPLNGSSWRLLERLGFRREGHLLQNVYFKKDADGQPIWKDTYEYALLRTEWPSGL